MVKSFRFLLNFVWVGLAAILSFIAVVIVGCYAAGVPYSAFRGSLFVSYYTMLPTFILLCLFLYAMSMCTTNLNLGLSMGARRGDFFWAIQGTILLYTVVGGALEWVLSALPAAAHWTARDQWAVLATYRDRPWIFPLLCITLQVLGCLLGPLMVRHRVLATIIIAFSSFIIMGSTMFMLLSAQTNIVVFLTGHGWEWLFATLPNILPAVLAITAAGGELLMWRAIQNYTVR